MNRHSISWACCLFGSLAVLALTGDRPQSTCGTTCLLPASSTLPPVPSPYTAQPEEVEANTATAGRKVFIDPDTGKIIPRPAQVPAVALAPEEQNALSTSSEGLREEPGTTRGGGVKVHLQGRFRSRVVATVGDNGQVATRCQTGSEAQGSASKP